MMCAIIRGEALGAFHDRVAKLYRTSALWRWVGVGTMCANIEASLSKLSYRSLVSKQIYPQQKFLIGNDKAFQQMQNSHAIQLDAPVLSQCGSKSCALGSMLGQGTMVQVRRINRVPVQAFERRGFQKWARGFLKVRLSDGFAVGARGGAPSVSFSLLKGIV